MDLKTKKPATYADIVALPRTWVGEIVDGTLYGHPRPAFGHANAQTALAAFLFGPYGQGEGGPGGWRIVIEPEVHLGDDVFVPDLAGWRKERMPVAPDPAQPYLTLAPDWVCEVLSPSTEFVDRSRKLPRYHQAGVSHAWIINPLERVLETYERDERGWLLSGTFDGDALVRAEPFSDSELQLRHLWVR